MSPAATIAVTFAATTFFVVAVGVLTEAVRWRYHRQTNERLDDLSAKGSRGARSALFKGLNEGDVRHESWRAWLDEYVDQAGLHVSATRLAGITLGLAIAATLVAGVASGRWWATVPAGVAGLMVVPLYVHAKRKRRMSQLFLQLPRALELITRAVRAGQTVPAAFRLVAEELEPPISADFQCCYERQNLGMSYDKSLRALARRTGIVELQILAVVLLVQSRTGGNLVELLGDLTDTVYKRLKFRQRVRALTSEGRMQAAVLIVLPTVAFVGLHFVSPDYVKTLHQHPKLLAVTIVAQLLGALWIRQYLKCDY